MSPLLPAEDGLSSRRSVSGIGTGQDVIDSLEAMLDHVGKMNGQEPVLMLRCPCHREPLIAWYERGGEVVMRCASNDDKVCVRFRIAP